MKIYYNKKLISLARQLRNNSTQSEIRLWGFLRSGQMRGYDFHRQKPIDNFIADFYCHQLKLVIELDGYTHQFEEVFLKDEIKESRLKQLGLQVIRFDDEEVMRDIDNVLRVIAKWFKYSTALQYLPTLIKYKRK